MKLKEEKQILQTFLSVYLKLIEKLINFLESNWLLISFTFSVIRGSLFC